MPESGNRPRPALARVLQGTAAFVIVVAGMQQAREIVVPFLLAGFLAVLCLPPLHWLERRLKFPRVLSVLTVILAVLFAGGGLAGLLASTFTELAEEMPVYRGELKQQANEFADWIRGVDLPLLPDARGLADSLRQAINTDAVLDYLASFASQLGGLLTNTLLIVLLMVFILMEGISIRDKVGLGRDDPAAARARFDLVLAEINRYMGLKTLVSLMTGAFVAGALALMGLNHHMLWGVLAFLFNYIPNLGSIIAAVPPVMLALLEGGPVMAGHVTILFVGVNMVIGNVVEPKLMGSGLGLSTLIVFLSLVFWGWLLGPVGMLLSVPLTMALKIGLEALPEGAALALWLGPPKAVAAATSRGGGSESASAAGERSPQKGDSGGSDVQAGGPPD